MMNRSNRGFVMSQTISKQMQLFLDGLEHNTKCQECDNAFKAWVVLSNYHLTKKQKEKQDG